MIIDKGKQVRLWGLLVLVFLPVNVLQAVEVKGLFEIELVANSESATDREQAVKQALYGVLSRVLVSNDISTLPVVQQLLQGAQHYVKQFQYSLIPADAYSDSGARLIRVEFDQDQLLEVIRTSRVGIWSEIRSETLIWLVVEEDGKRQLYTPDTLPEIESALSLASKVKGVPVIFPMLDLEEQQRISVSDVLSADSRNLLAASARYEVPAMMAGRLARKEQCWQAEWAFYFDNKIQQWSKECLPLKAAVMEGMRGAYQILSNYYGIKPND